MSHHLTTALAATARDERRPARAADAPARRDRAADLPAAALEHDLATHRTGAGGTPDDGDVLVGRAGTSGDAATRV